MRYSYIRLFLESYFFINAYSLKATSLSTSIHDGYASLPTQADYISNDEYGRI